ncbi:hypothetical protein HMI55_002597, partial [Coelomomyces lativittatus]
LYDLQKYDDPPLLQHVLELLQSLESQGIQPDPESEEEEEGEGEENEEEDEVLDENELNHMDSENKNTTQENYDGMEMSMEE